MQGVGLCVLYACVCSECFKVCMCMCVPVYVCVCLCAHVCMCACMCVEHVYKFDKFFCVTTATYQHICVGKSYIAGITPSSLQSQNNSNSTKQS